MSAADQLLGLTLPNGWKITRHLARHPSGSGGVFSQSYVAEKGHKIGFIKAFDFSPAFAAGIDAAKAIQVLVDDYNHEREVLAHCKDRRLSNIVLAIDHGDVQVPGLGTMEGRVFYLIFEMADGDVRVQMDVTTRFDCLCCMRALKDVCLGLWQVHKEMIAHQDAKPSNVLSYGERSFKVADFGRASRKGHAARHDNFRIAGDRGYAPPELLYGFTHPEFVPRRMGCDLYMLGNLAAFLFSGVNITARLFSNLDPQHHPQNWAGTYDAVLPYLHNAFSKVLDELRPLIDERVRTEVLALIAQLCDPDIAKRGHPKGVAKHDQYSLQRYVSELDLLVARLGVRLRAEARAA